ncbi:unnamed protein product [Lepeophtheirus salmonis]|uniref:(salmon louse) hypothetical protein n=1 Tax=Lepeophtheirus salmonis TaxID=72036 RepID=A0A7R8CWI8_LEPSM|nr:unnamed protein product [Lepeophtheirus salmonis]CAF2953672.1 unnamed protein product [Lepeophtheirus salmonis]
MLNVLTLSSRYKVFNFVWIEIFHYVSWIHVTEKGLDLLTTGNSTYTLEPRISSNFAHPSNWRLKITDLKPEDAGAYLCQISTFPPKVKVVYLEIHGPMIKIVRDQIVYNAGSNIEVSCLFRNMTEKPNRKKDALELMKESALVGTKIPPNVIIWKYNNKTFSQRNRRRVKTVYMRGYVESKLSIKSAIIQDSGNYSCILKKSPHNYDTLRITVVDGEHSAAIYKNSKKTLQCSF